MRKRVLLLLTAMAIAVLTAGVVLAQEQPAGTRPLTLTMSATADTVQVGEPVTFTITETNNQPFALEGLPESQSPFGDEGTFVRDSLPANVDFVSATPSQGRCIYVPDGLGPNDADVWCTFGTLQSGATAYIDVVVTPTEPGTITNNAFDVGENQASASVEVVESATASTPPGAPDYCGPWRYAWYVSRSGYWYYWTWRWCHNPSIPPPGWFVDWAGWRWDDPAPGAAPGYHSGGPY
jgi:Domain of unknown function DUF11